MAVSWDVEWVTETGSTNEDLLAAARAGAPEGRVLCADHQRAGRGRLGRSWVAPPGASLLCSVLLRPRLPIARVHLATTALSLSAADACGRLAGVAPELKWPNDLLVGRRKLGGVLSEAIVVDGRPEALIVGLGLNVDWPGDLPEDLVEIATALNLEGGRPVERRALLDEVLAGFEPRYEDLQAGRIEAVLDDARRRTATLGQPVLVELGTEHLVGDAVDLTADGHLVVDVDGTRREVAAGDVVHLRTR